MSFDPDKLIAVLRGLPAAQCYWVGFSGGLDSSVLLHTLAKSKRALATELRAVHVNHHIHPQSDDWQRHCERICQSLHIPLEYRGVEVKPEKGESLEAVAREQRYGVYRELMRAGDMLLLAQHQDDQMETFLLQALRGAGVRGLAAMPALADFGPGKLARPLLGFSRVELQVWAQAQKLTWLDDPSNADERFDRNYLRRQIIPMIRARWPAVGETVSRSARHCADTLGVLTTLAGEDLVRCADPEGHTLSVEGLQALDEPRAKNLLRHWLEKLQLPPPPSHKLEQVFTEMLTAGEDRNPRLTWEGAELHRYRNRLYGLPPLPESPAGEARLRRGEPMQLSPNLGRLSLVPATGEGLRAAACPTEGFRVGFRAGGEVCQPVGRTHHRPLKKWLQEFGVVPWMRERLPLVYAGGDLAAVAGLFVCAPFAAEKGEPGLRIEWRSHPRLH